MADGARSRPVPLLGAGSAPGPERSALLGRGARGLLGGRLGLLAGGG